MKTCMCCMQEYDERLDECPSCHYSDLQKEQEMIAFPDALPPETFLFERFVIGRIASISDYSILYNVWDPLLLRRVVIRELFPDIAFRKKTDLEVHFRKTKDRALFEQIREVFDDEASLLIANQGIRGIVNCYRLIRENNTSYLVMEYLPYKTLQDYLNESGTITAMEADRIFDELLETVKEMHYRGITHGNLSPDNILIDHEMSPRIIDFGSAKAKMVQLTGMGENIFDPDYTAPEVISGRGFSARSDVYSLGAIYYTLLTGKTPSLSARHNPKTGRPVIDLLLRKMLKQKPEDRFETIEQIRETGFSKRR